MKIARKPIFWIWFFVVLHSVIILFIDLIPFWDMPNHLAEATIYRYYNSSTNFFSQYYELVPWYFPNLFHIWICNLPIFPTVEWGNKFFFVLYFALFPTSIYAIIKQVGGNTWYALFSLVFLYGYNVTFGFVGYAISIPMLFWLFYFILRDIEQPGPGHKIAQATILLLIYFMHAQNALLGLLILGIMYLYHKRKRLLQLGPHILTGLPVVVFIGVWWFSKGSGGSSSNPPPQVVSHFINKNFLEYYERLGLFVFDNYQLYPGVLGILVALLLGLAVLFPLAINYQEVIRKGWRFLFHKRYVYSTLLLLIVATCYLLLPNHLPGQSPIAHRFSTILVLCIIILASLYIPTFTRRGKLYALSTVLVYSLLWGDYLIQFNQQNKDFNPSLFANLGQHQRLSGIILNNNYRGRELYTHFQNYFITWNQGLASTMAIDFRFGLVRRKAPFEVLPKHYEWYKRQEEIAMLLREANYYGVDLILYKGANEQVDQYLNTFTPLKQVKDWKLLHNARATTSFSADSLQAKLTN